MIQAFQPNTIKQPQTAPNPRRRVTNKARQTDMYRTTKPIKDDYIVRSRAVVSKDGLQTIYKVEPLTGTLRRATPRRHEL